MLGTNSTEVTVAKLANTTGDGALFRSDISPDALNALLDCAPLLGDSPLADCNSSGTNATCYGPNATASHDSSTALGSSAEASGALSTEMGSGATASQRSSTAMGV